MSILCPYSSAQFQLKRYCLSLRLRTTNLGPSDAAEERIVQSGVSDLQQRGQLSAQQDQRHCRQIQAAVRRRFRRGRCGARGRRTSDPVRYFQR